MHERRSKVIKAANIHTRMSELKTTIYES